MKKIQISVSLFALLLGASFAFSGSQAFAGHSRITPVWFSYNGSGDPTQPSNYTEVGSEPACSGNTAMCAIKAEASGGEPVITSGLKTEINNDLANHSSSADVELQAE